MNDTSSESPQRMGGTGRAGNAGNTGEGGASSTSAALLLPALFVIANAWGAVAFYHFQLSPPQKFGTVDVARVYREQEAIFTGLVARDGATDLDRARALDRAEAFGQRLPAALDALSRACGCTLFAANAVAGRYELPDYTEQLRTLIDPAQWRP